MLVLVLFFGTRLAQNIQIELYFDYLNSKTVVNRKILILMNIREHFGCTIHSSQAKWLGIQIFLNPLADFFLNLKTRRQPIRQDCTYIVPVLGAMLTKKGIK